MDVMLKRLAWASMVGICALLPINMAQAVNYVFPGGPSVPSVPQSLAHLDTLTVNSNSTYKPASTNTFAYAVELQRSATITIDAGSSIIYDGVGLSPAALRSDRSNDADQTININGTLSSNFAANAIYIHNSNAGNVDFIGINVTGAVIGGISTPGPAQVELQFNGAPTINGDINLGSASNSTIVRIGFTGITNFTTNDTLSNISLLRIMTVGSTYTMNGAASSIKALIIDSGTTMTLNNTISGIAGDGAITNNGTLVLTRNITKTGAFNTTVTTGNTKVTQAITVSTSNYANAGTHTAQLSDVLNYGKLTFSPAINPTFNIFTATYTGGYFPAGTYDLIVGSGVIANPATRNLPNNPSAFITFSNLQSNGATKIQITIARSLYQNYAKSTLTRGIANNLESIGAKLATTQNAQMTAVLNAVERSTQAGLNDAMKQLAPISTPPLHALTVQNESMKQVELRLASLRSPYKGYVAGSLVQDNQLWFRPFGAYANQKAINDIEGYYATTGGFAIGFDRDLDSKYNVGVAASYAISRVKDKINPNSLVQMKTYEGMLYGTYNFGHAKYLDWITGIGATNFTSNRAVNIQNFGGTANANYSGQQFSTKATLGKDYSAFDFLQVTPEASAQYSFATQYEYQESGAQGANLNVVRKNANVVQLGVGGKMSTPILLDRSTVIPEIHLMGLYNVVNGSQDSTFKFIAGGDPMTSHMSLSRGTLRMGAALTIAVIGSLELKLNYDCELQDRYVNHSGYLNFKYSL